MLGSFRKVLYINTASATPNRILFPVDLNIISSQPVCPQADKILRILIID